MSRFIPTYNQGEWTTTEFKSDEDLAKFALSIFSEPGKYEFDETAFYLMLRQEDLIRRVSIALHPLDQKTLCLTGMI